MPQWFTDLTSSQWWAASRHYITFGVGILAGFGLVTVAQQHDIIAALGDISDGMMKIVAGVGTLLTIAAPIINGWKSAHNASSAVKAASLEKEVPGTIVVTTPAIVKATPDSPNVVSNTDMKVVPK